MRKKFKVSSTSSKIISIFAAAALAVTGTLVPIVAANAAEGANDALGIDTTAVFNGTDAGLKANDSQIIPASGDFTVETWVQDARATSANHFNILAQTNIGSGNIGPEQFVIQTFDKQVRVYVGNQFLDTGIVLAQNVWYHIAATVARSGSNLTLSIYINGAYAAVKTFPVSNVGLSSYTPGNDFWVGSNPVQPSAEFWSGKIDQVKVWNDDLTEAQVAQSMHVYAATGVTSAPTLAGHFDFNEGNSDDGKIYNRADAAKDLTITTAGNLAWADVAEVVTGGNIDANRTVVYKFPRTYLTAQGGWKVPSNLTSIEALTVGGGGGGGENVGNGGSGGSISYHSGFAISTGSSLSVKVGQGGRPGALVDDTMYGSTKTTWNSDSAFANNTNIASEQRDGGDGQPSTISVGSISLNAPGGRGGMTYWTDNTCGSGIAHTAANTAAGAAGTGGTASGIGATGGQGFLNSTNGVGSASTNSYSISGSAYKFGAGGAGADGRDNPLSVAGGADGGGSSSAGTNITTGGNAPRGGNGAANSGSGGSGGNTYCSPGGAGGSGVVYIRTSAVKINAITGSGNSVKSVAGVVSGPAGTFALALSSTAAALNIGSSDLTTSGATKTAGGTGNDKFITYKGTIAQLHKALNFTKATLQSATGSGTIKYELNPVVADSGNTYFNEENAHTYRYVATTSTYSQAQTAANALSQSGLTGYLVNITSAEEQAFQYSKITTSTPWIGGREVTTQGNWVWADGPESGTQFLSGNVGGSPSKTTIAGQYQNFNPTEPNNNSGTNTGDDCAVGNFNASNQWDDVACSYSNAGSIVEFGGRSTDPGVTSAAVTVTLSSVNVAFSELNFNHTTANTNYVNLIKLTSTTTGSGTSAVITANAAIGSGTGTGKVVGDRVLFKSVTTRDGRVIDAVVTTYKTNGAVIVTYEDGAKAGGAPSYFQSDAQIKVNNGYVEYKFDFYVQSSSLVASCNTSVTCGSEVKVVLENVNVSAIDIDSDQWNDLTALNSFTLASSTNLNYCDLTGFTGNCTSDDAPASYPASMRYQGPSDNGTNRPGDMVVANYGSVESFSIKFGRKTPSDTNYYGVAFKALSWGSSTPQTFGDVAEEFAITYDSNSATSGSAPAAHNGAVGSQFTVASNSSPLARTGYTFAGWNTAADGSGDSYAAGTSILMPNNGTTLYAVWTASQYTLSYNSAANGGSGTPASSVHNAGATVTLSSQVPTKTGYIFDGWDTLANGTGTSPNLAAGGSYTMPGGNQTLYAQFRAATGTLAYDGSSPSSGSVPANNPGTSGTATTVSTNSGTLAKTGYSFGGWFTNIGGVVTDYAAGASINYPADGVTVTLYAKWIAVPYTLAYNSNGGSAAPASVSKLAGAEFALPASGSSPTRSGYTFAGWYTTQSGSGGTNYAAGATYTMPAANTTLYAKWTQINYNVTYASNAPVGSSATGSQTDATNYALAQSVTVANAGTLAVTSYRFTGWNTAADGTGTDYAAGNTFNMPINGITLYAQWVSTSIKLTYNGNGGSNVPPIETRTAGTVIALPSTSPERTGFQFDGWCADPTNDTTCPTPSQPSGSYTVPNTDTVLYAKWTAINYTFTYNANGGADGPAVVTGLNVGGFVTVSNTAPTRTGYSFLGWNSNMAGTGTDYSAGTQYLMGASNAIIYAKWQGDPFTLTYNTNGGTTTQSPTSEGRTAGSTENISAILPTRTGYTFTGWTTSLNGSGTSYSAGSSLTMPGSNVTLYAQWAAATNTVTYNANGGSGAPGSTSAAFGSTVTVSSAVPTRAGFTFVGWKEDAGARQSSYASADTFSMPATSITLYAQWAAVNYLLSYDANGGSGQPLSQSIAYDPAATSNATVSSSVPTRSGYDFLGWNTQVNGGGTVRAASATFAMPAANVTLYAQWSLATYTVYYNANGGVGTIAPQPGRYNTTITLTNSVPTRAGYTFVRWNVASDGTGSAFNSGATFTIPSNNTTLYAQWTATPYTITYVANGGDALTLPAAVTGKTVGETVTLSVTEPTRTDWYFTGWNTAADGSGQTYAPNTAFAMPAADVNLYARWIQNTYNVSYNANGGSGAPGSQTTVAGNVVVTTVIPTKPGYTFLHWDEYANDSGTDRASGSSYSPSGHKVLYAIWDANPITVSYNVNGGTGTTPTDQTSDFGTTIDLAGSGGFTNGTLIFQSWNTQANGSGTNYDADALGFAMPSSNITLYAIWSAPYFAVEFDPNGGTNAPSDQYAAPAQTVTIPASAPVLAEHEFVAWSDVSTGNTYSAGSTITMPTSNVTLVANYVRRASVGSGSGAISTPPITEAVTYPKKLNLTVYFKGDRSFLTVATKAAIKKLAATAKKYGYATSITIYGRVKETNDKSYDARLSKARATNVAKYLKKLGVTGAFKVIAAGIAPENKPISRRVDMKLFWQKR